MSTPILYRETSTPFHIFTGTLSHMGEDLPRQHKRQGKYRRAARWITAPLPARKRDNFVGRMMWALSDSSGLPARRFCQLGSGSAVGVARKRFSEDIYRQADLFQFSACRPVRRRMIR